jgi:hypothetical protein
MADFTGRRHGSNERIDYAISGRAGLHGYAVCR